MSATRNYTSSQMPLTSLEVSVHLVRLDGAPGYRKLRKERKQIRTYGGFAKLIADFVILFFLSF